MISGVIYYPIADSADMYKIRIENPANFQASLTKLPAGVAPSNSLYLFNSAGVGLDMGTTITGARVPAAGDYYLAVAHGAFRPVDDFFNPIWSISATSGAPNGSNAPVADWLSLGGYGEAGIYEIALGVPCAADFNGDDARDVADLFAYINAWLAKTSDADFNDSGNVDVADLFAYINAWLAGC